MYTIKQLMTATALIAGGVYLAQAESNGYEVGGAMPSPVEAHFANAFSIACSGTTTARVYRYEHGDEITLFTYSNDNEDPYGFLVVRTNTLLLDNDPHDGLIDRVEILSLEDDIKICGALPGIKTGP